MLTARAGAYGRQRRLGRETNTLPLANHRHPQDSAEALHHVRRITWHHLRALKWVGVFTQAEFVRHWCRQLVLG